MRQILVLLFLVVLLPVARCQLLSYDSISLEGYLDGVIQARMSDRNIAGATMVLVRDGNIVFKKGYGYADVENGVRVDPDRTLFRIGSISKLFVWTALMQLYEEGKIDLDDDINDYFVNFKVPYSFDKPVTIRHLMTHTAGFEDKVIGLFSQDSSSVRPISEILSEQIPERVRLPGRFSSYSNHGTAMAAHIVERVSGMSWDNYVEENILDPLDMTRTTFLQPVPDRLRKAVAKGYRYEAGRFMEQPFEYVPLSAIGGASATASDMAKFMMMHLQLGTYDSVAVLERETSRLMQQPAFRHASSVNPMRYGFMDFSSNGETVIGHGGDTFWFHSLMALWPDQDIGLFISFNSFEGGGTSLSDLVLFQILQDIMDRYFPEDLKELAPADEDDLRKFAGSYAMNRYPHSTLVKIMKLSGIMDIGVADGFLTSSMGGDVRRWGRVNDLTFRDLRSSDVLAFGEVENGSIEHLFLGEFPIVAFDRTSGIHLPVLHMGIFAVVLFFCALTVVLWPLTYYVRKGFREDRPRKLPLAAKYLGWFNALLYLAFLTGMAIALSDPTRIVYGVPPAIKGLLLIPILMILLTLLMWLMVIWVWKEGNTRRSSKLYYTLLSLVFVIAIWQLNYWNLLGWHY